MGRRRMTAIAQVEARLRVPHPPRTDSIPAAIGPRIISDFSGVRPSPGAALPDEPAVSGLGARARTANVAAPGDGRTPPPSR